MKIVAMGKHLLPRHEASAALITHMRVILDRRWDRRKAWRQDEQLVETTLPLQRKLTHIVKPTKWRERRVWHIRVQNYQGTAKEI